MKKLIISAIIVTVTFTSCNQKAKEIEVTQIEKTTPAVQLYFCQMHPEVTGNKGEKCYKCGMELNVPVKVSGTTETTITNKPASFPVVTASEKSAFTLNAILTDYLELKNNLVKDDSKAAANSSKKLMNSIASAPTNVLSAKLKAYYLDIAEDAKEHAEHIGSNAGKMDHQREHFAMLSKDVHDLIATFGTTKKLYQDYCPMYDEGKSGYWISEIKDIKNPYYGAQMLTCGGIKKTF